MANTDTNTDSGTDTDDTGTAPHNRERYPGARTSNSTDDRSSGTTDDFGALIARAGHAGGSAVWLAIRAVFVGLTAVVAVVRDEDSRLRTRRWLLLEGDRWTIIGVVTAGVFLGTILLGTAGVIGIRQSSFVMQLFASLTAGVISFTGIVISINQLVISRLFGTPETAREEIGDVRQFRKNIAERLPEQEVLPTKPAAFTSVVVDLLLAEVRHLREATGETGNTDLDNAIAEYTRIVAAQSESLGNRLHSGRVPLFEILLVMSDDSYSEYVNIARRIRTQYADSLSEAATKRLGNLRELFDSLTVTRQYFKTLYLHQAFGRLSRQLVYTGFGAFLTAVLVVLVFSTGYAPLRNEFVVLVFVGLALAVTVLPLVVFSVYMLRIATIIKRSSAPGPFTPEGQKPEYGEYHGGLDRVSDPSESPYWRQP